MTGLLPFIERSFGVLTDLSLLEVGDVAHPLLQELVRRAPGTYNHSINVASIGEAAAEPTPARIASLVHDLAMKRLLDGQFDECGLTLEELELIERSLVKSLTAVYHGRVKYPDQRTA